MAVALVVAATAAHGQDGGTTGAINTTGANLIVCVVTYLTGSTITLADSKSNTWTALTASAVAGSNATVRIYYCDNPTVGSGHTFTVSSGGHFYGRVNAMAFSGIDTTGGSFDAQNGGTVSSATSKATGAVTPATDGLAIICAGGRGSSYLNDAGFTDVDNHQFILNDDFSTYVAYKLASGTSSLNPTISWTTSDDAAVRISTFKTPAVAGGGAGLILPGRGLFFGQRPA